MSTQDLQAAVEQMQRTRTPQRDLWPGIERAINEAEPVPWYRHAAMVATVLLLLSASFFFGPVDSNYQADNLNNQLLLGLQNEHQYNKQSLLVQYSSMQPLYQNWEQQMHQLEQAEHVIYKALREEPDNLELLKILHQVQQKQLGLINTVFSSRPDSI